MYKRQPVIRAIAVAQGGALGEELKKRPVGEARVVDAPAGHREREQVETVDRSTAAQIRAEEVGYADMVTQPVQTALHNYLQDRFPEAAAMPVDYRWSGIMAFTKDELPIIGELIQQPVVVGQQPESVPGVFYAVGCNGHGMGYSFALSKLLVEVAMDGADAGIFGSERLLNSAGVSWMHALV